MPASHTRVLRRTASIGAWLVSPSVLFLTALILKYGFGRGLLFDFVDAVTSRPGLVSLFNILLPLLLLGGCFLAFIFNVSSIFRLKIRREAGRTRLIATLDIAPAPLLLATISGLLLASFLVYGLLQNVSIVLS